jgi:hypothetical protein
VQQLWTKPLADGAVAVLLINASPTDIAEGDWKIEFGQGAWLNMSSTLKYTTRDIWETKDVGTAVKEFEFPAVAKFDSAFIKFVPSN